MPHENLHVNAPRSAYGRRMVGAMYRARTPSLLFAAGVMALATVGATAACNGTATDPNSFDGSPPLSDAPCPVACGAGQVCEFPGAIGASGDANASAAASCQPMPASCEGNANCGCLWLALCGGGGGVGINCSYNPGAGNWTAQCIAQ